MIITLLGWYFLLGLLTAFVRWVVDERTGWPERYRDPFANLLLWPFIWIIVLAAVAWKTFIWIRRAVENVD